MRFAQQSSENKKIIWRKKMFKKVLSLILAVMMCLSIVACSTPGQQTSGNTGDENVSQGNESPDNSGSARKVLRYAMRTDVPTLDPQLMNSVPSATVNAHISEGLMRNHLGNIQNGIAESYEVSEDGKTYTFHLRDAKWSDGVAIKAQDFEYAFKRLADPATASPYSFIIQNLVVNAADIIAGTKPVDELGIKAVDDKTLTIELVNTSTYFLSMLSMAPFCPTRQDLVEKYGKDFAADADKNVYSGPFIVKNWAHEDRIILEKNPNFWDAGKIKLDEVQILTVPEAATALAMYEQGELDFTEVPTEVVSNYADQVTYYTDGADDFVKLNMNGTSQLSNKDLRLALNYAFNREDFVNLASNSIYAPNTRYVLPDVNGVSGKYGDEYPLEAFPLKGDAAKAKEHLDKAMQALGVTDPAKIKLELMTTDQERARVEAEVIQNQLQSTLGITVTIRQVPYKQRLELEDKREFEMVVSGWAPDYSDPMTYLDLWATNSPYNQISYSNPQYDEYINTALTEPDAKKRMDALFNAEKLLLEDAAIMPMHIRRYPFLVSDRVQGLETYFVGQNYDYIYADIVE
jgi:oligopeptide transport system substrate-binding protein